MTIQNKQVQEKPKRVVFWMSPTKYNKLRAKLMLIGSNASEWFRQKVDEFLAE